MKVKPRRPISLEGRVVIVTGASSGIGRVIAKELQAKGAKLMLAARRKGLLKDIAKGETQFQVTNVGNANEVDRLVEKTIKAFDRIDILINAAGMIDVTPVEKSNPQKIRVMIETNLLGIIHCCRAVLPVMRKQKSGHIVNISSVAGSKAQPNMAAYSATKFGVMGFSDALQQEVKEFGVKVTTLRPGTVITDLWKEVWTDKAEIEKNRDHFLTPEDVATSVIFALEQPPQVIIRDLFIHPL